MSLSVRNNNAILALRALKKASDDLHATLCSRELGIPEPWLEFVIRIFTKADFQIESFERDIMIGDIKSAGYTGPWGMDWVILRELAETNKCDYVWHKKRQFRAKCKPLTVEQVNAVSNGVAACLAASKAYHESLEQLTQRVPSRVG